jgi:hypothetical protein
MDCDNGRASTPGLMVPAAGFHVYARLRSHCAVGVSPSCFGHVKYIITREPRMHALKAGCENL